MPTRPSLARHVVRTASALAVVLSLASAAEAGQPLICRSFDAGSAKLLPWSPNGGDWNSPDRSYDIRNLTADTLKLLTPDAPILARMENLRRATIYASRDPRVAGDLLTALTARAQADTGKGQNPLAWFDAGYLVESIRQAASMYKFDILSAAERSTWAMRTDPKVDGYAMVKKAIQLAGTPEMEFAASLMKGGPAAADHRRKAAAGATAGSLLAKNLGSH